MKPTGLSIFEEGLLDRPCVVPEDGACAVCGRPATDLHHVVPKRMGGMSGEVERRVPLIALCGSGNLSGCHGMAHSHHLHFAWDEGRGGWLYLVTDESMPDWWAWEKSSEEFLPLPAWERGR